MLISNDRGGGEIVSSSEDTRFYDDIGCLAADWVTHGEDARAYVRLPSGQWSEAHAASYAQPNGVETPMGSGFAAFATIADARAADRSGRVLTFEDVVALTGAKR